MRAYLIHCLLFPERLAPALAALTACEFEINIVSAWDADQVNTLEVSRGSQNRWEQSISAIAPILIANAIRSAAREISDCEALKQARLLLSNNQRFPAWMSPRCLLPGEVSVLMKHFYALSSIANGPDTHGLVAEDDILMHENTAPMITEIKNQLSLHECDYIDLAGGAGLHVDFDWQRCGELLRLVHPQRTRTNACYIVSKAYALKLVNRYFPLIFPIDWHLQYLFFLEPAFTCYWSNEPVLLHGSELDNYISWRS